MTPLYILLQIIDDLAKLPIAQSAPEDVEDYYFYNHPPWAHRFDQLKSYKIKFTAKLIVIF